MFTEIDSSNEIQPQNDCLEQQPGEKGMYNVQFVLGFKIRGE